MESDSEINRDLDSIPLKRIIGLGFLGWLAMLGIDFFLHAGLLARLYAQPSPFLLPPQDAFRLIPLGYLSFLLLDILILWLMVRLRVTTWRRGLIFGLKIGGLVWGALALGLLSISTASKYLLLGWFAGQTVELGVAGAVIGSGLSGTSLRKILFWVIAAVLVLLILAIVMQNVGLAPAAVVPA